jgi:hypothetical protein
MACAVQLTVLLISDSAGNFQALQRQTVSLRCMDTANLIYTVVGQTSSDAGLASDLDVQIGTHNLVSSHRQGRDLVILGVRPLTEADDFKLLSRRFGDGFIEFLLLNDVAIEACKALHFPIKPLGTIARTKLLKPATVMMLPYRT